MAEVETTRERRISCLDDVPEAARRGARQKFLYKWYAPLAFFPFVIVLLVDFGPLHGSGGSVILKWGLVSLLWAAAVVGDAFYLIASFRCPVCHARYGLGNSCRSCELPRHSEFKRVQS